MSPSLHLLHVVIWVLTESYESGQRSSSLMTYLNPKPKRESKVCVYLPRHAPLGVRAGGRGLGKVLEETDTGLWRGKTRFQKNCRSQFSLRGKSFNLRMCYLSLHGKRVEKMSFWKELCSSSKLTMSLPFVADFNPLFQLFSHLKS